MIRIQQKPIIDIQPCQCCRLFRPLILHPLVDPSSKVIKSVLSDDQRGGGSGAFLSFVETAPGAVTLRVEGEDGGRTFGFALGWGGVGWSECIICGVCVCGVWCVMWVSEGR